jgi:hypothetical protein
MLGEILVAVIGFGVGVAAAGFVSLHLIHRNELRIALEFQQIEEALRRLDVRVNAIERRA